MITRAFALLLPACLFLFGCACSPTDSQSEAPDSAGTTSSATAPSEPDALPGSPIAAIAAAIAPVSDYTAEVSEIASTGSKGDYAAVATFNTAQGRDFEMTVEDSASGQLLANTTVTGISSALYSHSLPFRHSGSLSTVVVRIVDKESSREVDRWSPE